MGEGLGANRARGEMLQRDFVEADRLRVVVLVSTDGMAAPADDELRVHPGVHDAGIPQHLEDGIGHAGGGL